MKLQAFKIGDSIPEAARYLFFRENRHSGDVVAYFLVPETYESIPATATITIPKQQHGL